jgi:sec-independent protein translocase protein TatA
MFGSIGPAELILIFVIALLVFGPKKLPEIGRQVGKALREFKKTSDEIKGRIEEEIQASELKDIRKDIQSGVDDLRSSVTQVATDLTRVPEEIKKDTESHETGEGPKVA